MLLKGLRAWQGQLQHQQEHQQELRRSTRPFKPVAAVMDQDRDSATASLESRCLPARSVIYKRVS